MLKNELTAILDEVSKGNATNHKVSDASVYWHLEHLLKVISGITLRVSESNEKEYSYRWSTSRFFVLNSGIIPRGAGKSPKAVLPTTKEGTETEISKNLKQVKQDLEKWGEFSAKVWFLHPYFGKLNKRRSQRFIKVHTKHHLKIIRDIRKG